MDGEREGYDICVICNLFWGRRRQNICYIVVFIEVLKLHFKGFFFTDLKICSLSVFNFFLL